MTDFLKALSLIRSLIDSANDIEWRQKLILLQSMVIDLQTQNFELAAENHQLRDCIHELKQAEAQKHEWQDREEDFPLADRHGVTVRRGHNRKYPMEPPHDLCPHCFQKRVYAPINPQPGTLYRICPACQCRFP